MRHKLHTKHASKSSESEQAISILKAGKLEDQNDIECQKLTSSLICGGYVAQKNSEGVNFQPKKYIRLASLSCIKQVPPPGLAFKRHFCNYVFLLD